MQFKVGDRIKFDKDMGRFAGLIGTISYKIKLADTLYLYVQVLSLNPRGDVYSFVEGTLNARIIKPISFHYSI